MVLSLFTIQMTIKNTSGKVNKYVCIKAILIKIHLASRWIRSYNSKCWNWQVSCLSRLRTGVVCVKWCEWLTREGRSKYLTAFRLSRCIHDIKKSFGFKGHQYFKWVKIWLIAKKNGLSQSAEGGQRSVIKCNCWHLVNLLFPFIIGVSQKLFESVTWVNKSILKTFFECLLLNS